MRYLVLIGLFGLTTSVLAPAWMSLIGQADAVPSVFLSEKLWSGGIIGVLAAFLLWQSNAREVDLRKEARAREERMAALISSMREDQKAEVKKMTDAVHTITDLHEHMTSCRNEFGGLREVIMKNTADCNVRREQIVTELKKAKRRDDTKPPKPEGPST